MVAVVSGSGLGLFNSSASSTGTDNAGNAQVGRGRDRYVVNTTTGNLVIQSTDEVLTAVGLDLAAARTYNSQGTTDEDNGDQWRLGVHMRLSAVTGGTGVNTANSRLTKTFGDGAEIVYTYNTTRSRYESTDGDGANDFLVWNGSVWTWTDGSSRVVEEYALISGVQRIRFSRDGDGNAITYNYTGSLLTTINMANPGAVANNAQTVTFSYTGTNLMSIAVQSWNGTALASQTLTSYTYDANRLRTVTVDLTPTNTSDSSTYTTTYSYDGTSKRVTSITQTDGSSVTFTYQNINGDYRVRTVTDGENRTTTFSYEAVLVNGGTPVGWSGMQMLDTSPLEVVDPQIGFDANGNGIAIWAQEEGELVARRYDRASNTWGAAVILDLPGVPQTTEIIQPISLSVDSNGNAVAAWVHTIDGWDQWDLYARRFDAATNTWSALEFIHDIPRSGAMGLSTSIRGTYAAIAWENPDFATANVDMMVARWNGSSWSSPMTVETMTGSANRPSVAVDSTGRITVGWQQGGNIYTNRYNGSAWAGATTLESTATSANDVKLKFDSSGNGIAIWSQGTDLLTRRYTASTNTWGTQSALDTGSTVINQSSLSVDPSGNAIAAWAQNDGTAISVFASRYTVSTGLWSTAAQLDSSTAHSGLNMGTSIAGSLAMVTWVQPSGTSNSDAYAARWNGSTWTVDRVLQGTGTFGAVGQVTAAIDSLGNATVLANYQEDSRRLNAVANRFNVSGTSGSGPATYQRTIVQDPLSLVTTYLKDPQGRLISTTTDAGETRYTYDPVTGNVATIVQDPTGLNRVTTFSYDPVTGLLLTSRDSLGNTVSRTYNANNQLETETTYTGRSTSGTPTGAMVARYIYDSFNHLRFALTADSRVTEHVYNARGERVTTYKYAANTYPTTGAYTESALNTWALGQRVNALELTEYTYDFRSNVQLIKRYATTGTSGAGTGTVWQSRYGYDQRGLLISTVDTYGEATTTPTNDYVTNYTYDGLGRSLRTSSWVSSTETSRDLISIAYQDATRQTVSTFAGGRTQTEVYNRSGDLVSVTLGPIASSPTLYTYDADGLERVKESGGVKTYCFYDNAGRKIGYVDGDGSLTEYVYNRANQVVKTIRYATRLSSDILNSLSAGGWQGMTFSYLRFSADTNWTQKQLSRNVYDASGTLVFALEPIAWVSSTTFEYAVTKNIYDGAGRLTDQIRFFNTQTLSSTVDEVLPAAITVGTNAADRRTRYFYNSDGQLAGTLDGAGYLKENVYDAAGRLITTIGYYNPSDTSRWATGTLDTLRPGSSGSVAQLDPARDVRVRTFHDAQGRKIGELDGEKYLTEFTYDITNVRQTIRYNRQLTDTLGTATFSTLKNEAVTNVAPTHVTRYTYNGLGQVLTELNFENTETLYSYDLAGNLLATTRANNVPAEARTTRTRYDALGRVTHELSAEGAVALAALPGTATQGQIDAVWNNYGIAYGYDNASRRISATVRPNDTQVNTTYYYYDGDGRVRFELGPLGHVIENRYDALGQLTDKLEYWRAIALPSQLGGLLTPTLITALTLTESANVHKKTTYTYSLRGAIKTALTAAAASTANAYNVFGEARLEQQGTQTGLEYTYDARGYVRTVVRNGVTLETRTYDAFGRLSTVVDVRGNTTTTTYDRMGREVTSTETGDANTTLITYDAFSRVTNSRDKLLNSTAFLYDDSARTVRMTTQEGVVALTTHNRHGQDVTVLLNGNTTTYGYDVNGRLTSVTDNVGTIEAHSYDRAGREVETRDGRGIATRFEYDAANRLFRRTVDSAAGGLQLVTTFAFDPNSRVLTVTEPGGRVTRTEYDRDGRVAFIYVDYGGPAQRRTDYTYDAANNELTVTEFAGTALPRRTRYVYDNFGRRTDMYVADGAQNLRTRYFYDALDNLTRVIDSRGYSTWYVYDVQGRTTHTIDGAGGVTQMTYDIQDRVIETRVYTAAINVASLATVDVPTTSSFTLTTSTNDQINRTFFDRDGRAAYSIDSIGTVTHRSFDDAGNVTRTRRISAVQLKGGTYANAAAVADRITLLGASALALADQVSWTAYDARSRAEFTIDSMNGALARVVRYTYDLNDNVIAQREYFTARAISTDNTLGTMGNWHTSNALAADDHVTLFWYDSLDRARFVLDAEGYVTQNRYDNTTRATQTIRYATRPSGVTASSTITDVGNAIVTNVADQSTTVWVDATDRTRFVLDSEGYLTETQYNNNTGAVTQVAYAVKPGGPQAVSTTLETMVASRNMNANDRTTTTWVDAANRQRFVLDPEGYLQETRYNDTTGSKTVYAYLTRQSFTSASTLANLTQTGAIVVNAEDQNTLEEYDGAGRLSRVTDSRSKSENYVYDGAGNKTKFVNKMATSSTDPARTWTYEYDENGRLVRELSPSVSTLTVTESGGVFTLTPVTAPILTTTVYDVFGNITSRIEADGIANQARTTSWEYDALGRQITTIAPAAGIYNAAAGDSQTGGTSAVARTEFTWRMRSEVAYDVFGNAFRNRRTFVPQAASPPAAPADIYTYKAYDKLNRVVYDIDNKNQVTKHTLDGFGNETEMRLYATARATTSPLPATGIGSLRLSLVTTGLTTNDATDRMVTKTFDRMNRVLSTKQPAAWSYVLPEGSAGVYVQTQPTSESMYNAFGEVVRMRDLMQDGSPQTWATAYKYYDHRGLVTGQVDAGKYYTRFDYDAFGNQKVKYEYAQKNTGTIDETTFGTPVASANGAALGSDRVTNYFYDQLNRLISETRVNFEYSTSGSSAINYTTAGSPAYIKYGYDALGNQTRMEDALGGVTYTFYDVLGRVTAIASPLRNRGEGTAVMGYSRMLRDAHGTLAQQIDYYNGLAATAIGTGDAPDMPSTPATDLTNDRVTTIASDSAGHALAARDAVNAIRYTSYNERGDIAKEWQPVLNLNTSVTETRVTLYRYDAAGQLTQKQDTQRSGVAPVIRVQDYNAFGDVTLAYNAGAAVADQEFFHYDQQGRVWRTNSGDGIDKILMYNLTGRTTLEIRSQNRDLANSVWTNANLAITALNADATANVMRTETVYDIRGNAIEERTPTFNTGTPAAIPQAISGTVSFGVNANFTIQPTQYYIYWTPAVAAQRASFGYRLAGSSDAFTEIYVYKPTAALNGSIISDLDNRTYEYRIAYFGGSDPMAVSETMGTFQLNRTASTTVTIAPSVDSIPTLLNSNHVNGYITWTASVDTAVIARMRINGGAWILATRPNSTTFQVDVRNVIGTAGNYSWDIEYLINGPEPIAKKSGTLNTQITRTLTPTGTQTINTPTPWGGTIGNPWATGTGASRTIGWNGPASLPNEVQPLVVELTYQNVSGGGPTTVVLSHNGSAHTLNIGGLAANRYQYVLTYKVGGRQVAQQSGAFTTTDAVSGTFFRIQEILTDSATVTPPIGTITGLASGQTVTWSNVHSEQVQQRFNDETGNYEWYWDGQQWFRPSWTGTQGTAWVQIDYMILNGQANAEVEQRSYSGLMVRDSDNYFGDGNSYGYYDIASLPLGGCGSVVRVRVFTAEGGTLIADSSGGGTSRSITWAAPSGDTNFSANVFYENGTNNWVLVGTASRSGDTFTRGMDVVPSGRRIKIEYQRPNENWAFNTAIATFTYSGSSAPTLSGLTTSNHDPAVLNTLDIGSGSTNNGSLRWTGAIAAGGRMTFDIKFSGVWQTQQQWTSGSSFSYDLSAFGFDMETPWPFEFRIQYFGPTSTPWVTNQSSGTMRVRRYTVNDPATLTIDNLATINSPSSPATTFSSTLSSTGLSWTRSKDVSTDTVRLTYWRSGGTVYTEDLTGAGPGFSSILAQLPDSSGTLFWHIDYYRTALGHTNSYARSYGQMTFGVATILSAQITAETPAAPTYRSSDRALVLTSPASSISDIRIKLLLPTGLELQLTVLADGANYKALLPNLLPNGNYQYLVEYRNASDVLYGKISGTMAVNNILGTISSGSATKSAAVRPETTLEIGMAIGTRAIVNPPYAVYHLVDGGIGGDSGTEELPDYLEFGATRWASSTTFGGGGWYARPGYLNPLYPQGFDQLAQSAYNYYDNHTVISWERDDREGYQYKFEYWPTSNPAAVNTLQVVGPGPGYWAVDVNHLSGTFGWRLTRTHTDSPIVLGTREGTFTRGSTNSVAIGTPTFTAPANVTPLARQEYDRWNNMVRSVDTAGNVTRFRYNSLNKLVKVTEASDLVFDRRVNALGVAPTVAKEVEKRNYYDLLGRLIETQDGYDQVNRVTYNLAGQALTMRNADAARYGNVDSLSVYDIFGNLTQTVDQLGYITRNKYDALGNLKEVWREIELNTFTNKLVSSDFNYVTNGLLRLQRTFYVYDAAGRRVRETNNANEVINYHFDLSGHIIRRVQPGGAIVDYVYDPYGNKVEETDQLGSKRSWTYDAFGRMQTHTELSKISGTAVVNYAGGGLVLKYDYNQAGQLTFQRTIDGSGNPLPGGQNLTFEYDAAGHLKLMNDAAASRLTSYRFDAAGRQVRETVVVAGNLHQDTRVAYDAHNRVKSLADPDYALNIVFDVNGNRAQLRSTWAGLPNYKEFESLDYEYDEMNRITRTVIDPGETPLWGQDTISEVYEYNARGERVRRTAIGRYWERRANGSYTFFPPTGQHLNPDPIDEQFFYDGLGRLKNHKRDLVTSTGKRKVDLHIYTYDAGSRVKTDHATNVEDDHLVLRKTTNFYLADGRLDRQEVEKGNVSNVDAILTTSTSLEQRTTYGRSIYSTASADSYNSFSLGIDDAGNVRGYRVEILGDNPYTTTYRTKYQFGDNYQERDQRADSDVLLKRGTTTRNYNANHEFIQFLDQGDSQSAPYRRRDLVNNQGGQILTGLSGVQPNLAQAWDNATQGLAGERVFYWQNQQVGSFIPAQSVQQTGLYQPKFDVNSTPISGYSDVPPSVVAQAGDTLRIVAARVYGDEGLWYLIAQENGFTNPDDAIAVGTQLRIPNKVYSLSNTSDSFKPFDASSVLGNLTPTQDPKDIHCKAFATILGMVVSLILMIVLVPTMGPWGAAIASAAGNMVSQYTLLMANGLYDWDKEWDGLRRSLGLKGNFWDAMGDLAGEVGKNLLGAFLHIPIGAIDYWVNKDEPNGAQTTLFNPLGHGAGRRFDRRSVAISAASAAAASYVTSGVSSALKPTSLSPNTIDVLSAGAGAVAGYTATYGMNKAFGRDTHFSWRDVAVSALSAMAGAKAGQLANHPIGSGIARKIASMEVNVLAGGKEDPVVFLADVFMNAVADSIQYHTTKTRAEKQREQLAREEMEAARARQDEPTPAPIRPTYYGVRVLNDDGTFSNEMRSADEMGFEYSDVADVGEVSPAELPEVAFESAVQRLGRGKPYVLYDAAIGQILRSAEMGVPAVEATGGWFGSDYEKLGLTLDETQAVASYIRASGVADSYSDIAGGEMLLLTNRSNDVGAVDRKIRSSLGNLVTSDDVQQILPSEMLGSHSHPALAINLTPLKNTIVDRFYSRLAQDPEVLAAAEAHKKADYTVVGPDDLPWMVKTSKGLARDRYDSTMSRVRSGMIRAGMLPERIATAELGKDIYSFIGMTMLGVATEGATNVAATRVFGPLLRRALGGPWKSPPNLTSRGTWRNVVPEDPIEMPRGAGTLVRDANGRFWLQQGQKKITPTGSYDFVTLPNGKIKMARTNTNRDLSTHLGLSGGNEVRYAGSIQFAGGNASRGSILNWSNTSGHYMPTPDFMRNAGLPPKLFVPYIHKPIVPPGT